MENKKLKKLELKKTNKISLLNNEEQSSIKGGMYWSDEFGMYVVGEDRIKHCTICESAEHSSGGPLFQSASFVGHLLGWHNHDSTTYYTYR